ncbi:ATP-dependent RecD-like DNA helicase [Candidatus Uabimicrobium sp. HlEnr_7]|uniref:SF1B family DNA helicase RecD2 n=1 Tax=Candidatus Uabimicrobium helgolandensis TaxID=3095367 RepID=UPI003557FF72
MVNVVNTKVENLEGVLESVIFTSEETHFTIARFTYKESEPSITVVGNIFSANVGEKLRISGVWKKHAKYGLQLEIERFEVILPTQKESIEKYLASGIVSGIGPSLAKRIVKHFGDSTFEVLDKEPQRIQEVQGIGEKKAADIENSWKMQRNRHEMMLFLTSHGIKGSRAAKIYKKYGGNLVAIIKNNPYRLAIDIDGIGFLTADKIAREVGIPEDSPERIEAAILHTMGEASSQGHCYLPQDMLVDRTYTLLKVDPILIADILQKNISQQKLMTIEDPEHPVYLKRIYFCETQVARYLSGIMRTAFAVDLPPLPKIIKHIKKTMNVELHPEQKNALELSLTNKISLITGGPGVGKTTIIKALVSVLQKNDCRIALAAPTGRAAKRLAEASGTSASTIHRLLHYNPHENAFEYNKERHLEIDWLIIDETSMMDISLSYHLVSAIPPGAGVTFVGDCDQLPSVGPGNFLGDLITSDEIPLTRLTHIYRQSTDSSIVRTAHEINSGSLPQIINSDKSDIFFLPTDNPQEGAKMIVDLVSSRLRKKYNLDPIHDIQTLVPMYRGEVGADNLNALLSQSLNASEKKISGGKFREGDKVMQVSNNYEKDVYNGDIGIISGVNRVDHTFTIAFDHKEVNYEFSELDQLALAYAISIHKSQGSEYPVVIIPVFTQHYIMLQRNLLYTAITRGKKMVVIVGSWRALGIAVRNVESRTRYTKLAHWLCQ